MSNCGSKFNKCWTIDKLGYLSKKIGKDGKQEKINQYQDIQDHFGEVDFKSRVEANKKQQDEIMDSLNEKNLNEAMRGKIYDDVNSVEWVDTLNNLAKLRATFVNENGFSDSDFFKRVNSFLLSRKAIYENLARNKKQEAKKVEKQEVKKVEDKK